MADFGYDVADYCDIDPMFGTLADFDDLVREAHARGLKVILDFVPNHTSDQHPWFAEAAATRANPKRDWYLWRDPAPDGGPPNNWLRHFGGPAWTFDPATGQYYLHSFLREQPDLNWRNPEVRAAMYDVLRFWLERGVDGFRVDVIWLLIKDDGLRDNPPNPALPAGAARRITRLLHVHNADRPRSTTSIAEMRALLDELRRAAADRRDLPARRAAGGLLRRRRCCGAHLPFNFQLIAHALEAHARSRG